MSLSNPRGLSWSTSSQSTDHYFVNNVDGFKFESPGDVDDGHDPGSTQEASDNRSHSSQQQQTTLLSHHADDPPFMSFNRFQDHSDEYADYYNEDYYDDDRSDYTYDPDDGDSANCIEVGSAQFDAQSLVEGPAVTGSWSAASVRSGISRGSDSYGRRASTTSSGASSSDWRRLLGPVNLPSTPEFASSPLHFRGDDSTPPSPADATDGFNVPYIMQGLSSASLTDIVSKSPTAEKQQHLQEYSHHLDLSTHQSLLQTPSPYQSASPSPSPSPSPSSSPISPTPTEAKQYGFPLSPVVQQLREFGTDSLRRRPLSIQSVRTTGTFSLDDSFNKGLMSWGGDGYVSSRREWVIKKDKERNQYRNPNQNFNQAKRTWKGLYPGDKEVWHNYLLGNFSVSREDISSGTSSRTSNPHGQTSQISTQSRVSTSTGRERDGHKDRSLIQQRLVIRKLKEQPTLSYTQSKTSHQSSPSTASAIPPPLSSSTDKSSEGSSFSAAVNPNFYSRRNDTTDTSVEGVNLPHALTQPTGASNLAVGTNRLVSVRSDGTINATTQFANTTNLSINTAPTASSSKSSTSSKERAKINSDTRHPPVIVHRHSKVTAFSISRHYRPPGAGAGAATSSKLGSVDLRPSSKSGLGTGSNIVDPVEMSGVKVLRDRDRDGRRDRDRDKDKHNKERVATVSSTGGAGTGSKRSQNVMLATREVQEQFFDAFSKARNTKNLLVGAGLAVDKKAMSARREKERERERIRGKEKEKERFEKNKGKGKEKERERDKDKSSPRTHAKVPSAVTKQKSESVLRAQSGGCDDAPDSEEGPRDVLGPSLRKSPSSGLRLESSFSNNHQPPANSVGIRSMPEKRTKALVLDSDKKHSQSLLHTNSAPSSSSSKHSGRSSQRPTRPRLPSLGQLGQSQQSRTSPTQSPPENSTLRSALPQQTAQPKTGGLLKRWFRDTSSNTSSSSGSPSKATGTTSASVASGVTGPVTGNGKSMAKPSTLSGSPTIPGVRDEDVQRLKMIDNLETSFENIGLLPPIQEREPNPNKTSRQRLDSVASSHSYINREKKDKGKGWLTQKRIAEDSDVIGFIPPEALFMILPLWPEETDDSQKTRSFVEEERKYLLVYFKPTREEEFLVGASQRGKEKERDQEDGDGKPKNLLLSSFHVVALIVSHEELQGIRVTLPKEGLVVNGSMEEAYKTIPPGPRYDSSSSSTDISDISVRKYLLAYCNSRETGLEFDPEALIQLGLCSVVNPAAKGGDSEPLPPGRFSEEFDAQRIQSLEVKLTPLGSAIMEMIWCGSLALTSFGSGY